MAEPPVPREQRRVSHAERDEVAERLREAAGDGRITMDELDERLDAAFAATTYADLEPLTRDLPDEQGRPVPAPRADVGPVQRVGGRPGKRWSVAVMGGTDRKGSWSLGSTHTAVALMGGVELDLTEAVLESREVTIWAFALMGGVDVVVPEDCELDASGLGLMGGFTGRTRTEVPVPSGAPVVRVRGLALMGGVDAVRRGPKPSWSQRRRLAREERHGLRHGHDRRPELDR